MDGPTTVLKIPPIEYPTIRRLSLAFAIAMASEAYDFIFEKDMLIVKEPVEDILPRTFDSIIRIYKSREEVAKKEALASPMLITNLNDFKGPAKKLSSQLGFSIDNKISIGDFFIEVISRLKDLVRQDPVFVKNELEAIESKDGMLYLGTRSNATISHLQLFKLEKYKYGKDYLSYTDFKGTMKISPVWYGVLGGGWLLTFAGYRGNTILNVIIDDHIALSSLIKKGVGPLINALKEYSVLPLKVNYPPTHTEAYLLLLALSIDPDRFVTIMTVPLRYSRIVIANNMYTIIEEFNMDVSPIYKSISIILTKKYEKLLNAIKQLLNCTLRAYGGGAGGDCKDWGDASDMSSMVRSLWNIMMDMDPYTNVYKLIRLSPSEGYNFRDPNLAKLLLDWVKEIRK